MEKNEMNRLIVISGCSGGGKSSLLSELSSKGYSVVPEAARAIIKEQLEINGTITPWQNPKLFGELLFERSVAAYQQAKEVVTAKDQVIFFDRCFLEVVSWYQNLKIADSNKYDHFIDELRYYHTILMTPPWKEIYRQDDERKHSFEDGVEEYERLLESYAKYGYKTLEIPKINVKERFKFVMSIIT